MILSQGGVCRVNVMGYHYDCRFVGFLSAERLLCGKLCYGVGVCLGFRHRKFADSSDSALFRIADYAMVRGVSIDGWGTAILASLLISVISSILNVLR